MNRVQLISGIKLIIYAIKFTYPHVSLILIIKYIYHGDSRRNTLGLLLKDWVPQLDKAFLVLRGDEEIIVS